MTNYPPGVTGNEYEIAGPDFEEILNERCPQCYGRDSLIAQGYRGQRWVVCVDCDYYKDRSPEWCCDAGPVGHSGRCWLEGSDE